LSFEENRGQVDKEVKYISRGRGYTLFLTSTEAVLSLSRSDGKQATTKADALRPHVPAQPGRVRTSVVRMKLKGANPSPAVTGESEMRVRTNYFKGNDPAKWQTDVARYELVRYSQVYPGIDMIYYGQQQQLEYDFEVAPGADSRQIGLEYRGVKRVKIERGTGDLILKTAGGEVRQHKPVAYQEVGGERRQVASRYVMKGKGKVGIVVGEYDRAQRLVIDPVLSYSTYLGGSSHIDSGQAIAVDASGNVYVTGTTASSDFPTRHQYQTFQGYNDAFVTKLDTNASGTASLRYSTFLGGNDQDFGAGIAVDASGFVYVTGYTTSPNFPTLHQYQTFQGGYMDAFVTKLVNSHTISGRVTNDAVTGINGVTIAVSGSMTTTTVTDGDGNYSIELAVGGNYTLTPSKDSLNFIPSQRSFTNLQADQMNVNFATQPVIISGKVTKDTATGAGLAGVTITLTGNEGFTPRTVTTSSDGTYSFSNVPVPRNYRVTPSKTNYVFSPSQVFWYNVTTNQTKNFIATLKNSYKISGVVKLGPDGLSGVTVKLTSPTPAGFTPRTTTTGSTGAYSFTGVPAGRNYTVTPQKTGYQFTPASKTLSNLSTSQTAVDFLVKVYSITGRITRTGTTTGISAVTVTVTSPTPAGFPARTGQTGSEGYYKFFNVPAGRNYTIKPTKSGFTFSPATRQITNLSGNILAGPSTNFTGTGP
jgi:Carboxypeptidase regulatory-like domain/Beta-propeller repeat/SdrD B-like domain